MRVSAALMRHAEAAAAELLRLTAPADQALSAYFRTHRNLGQKDRAFVAETAFAVLVVARMVHRYSKPAFPSLIFGTRGIL